MVAFRILAQIIVFYVAKYLALKPEKIKITSKTGQSTIIEIKKDMDQKEINNVIDQINYKFGALPKDDSSDNPLETHVV